MNNGCMLVSICIVCMTAIFFSGCLGSHPGQPLTPVTEQRPTEVFTNASAEAAVVDANTRFALKLYSALGNDPLSANATVFFSPFSISSAMAVAAEGARGTTADEIRAVFSLPESGELRAGYQQFYAGIGQGNVRNVLKTANALWAEKTYPLLPDFMRTAQVYYHANATNLDFRTRAESSRVTINAWVGDQTGNRIQDLIPPGGIDPMTRLVITNAVYFKGVWAEPFDRNQTRNDTFTTAPGSTVPVRMMVRNDSDAIFGYLETDTLQVLEMPYAADGGHQLSMLIILPKAGFFSSVEKSLDVQNLSGLRGGLTRQRVSVEFPRFTLDTRYSLPGTLASMGMPTAFTDRADFSGMDGTGNLYIGDVIHQAYMDVNEEGTEAAAATAVVEKAMATAHEPPLPLFRADHPFIVLIQDDATGAVLFMGRVSNPNG